MLLVALGAKPQPRAREKKKGVKEPFPSGVEEGETVLLLEQELLLSDAGHSQHWLKDHSHGATGDSGAEVAVAESRKAVEQRKYALRGQGKG